MGKIISHYEILEKLGEDRIGVVYEVAGGGEKKWISILGIENLCLLWSC